MEYTHEQCKVNNCDSKVHAKGYCKRHYSQIRQNGRILKRTRYDENEIVYKNKHWNVILYDKLGKYKAKTIIDKKNIKKVHKHKWHEHCGYVATRINRKTIFLHQLIMGVKNGYDIDHINHDKLDNREKNLRHVTRSQNMMNIGKIRGVSFTKRENKWVSYITINYKQKFLGYSTSKKDAIKLRKMAEEKYYGEYTYRGIHSPSISSS